MTGFANGNLLQHPAWPSASNAAKAVDGSVPGFIMQWTARSIPGALGRERNRRPDVGDGLGLVARDDQLRLRAALFVRRKIVGPGELKASVDDDFSVLETQSRAVAGDEVVAARDDLSLRIDH